MLLSIKKKKNPVPMPDFGIRSLSLQESFLSPLSPCFSEQALMGNLLCVLISFLSVGSARSGTLNLPSTVFSTAEP